MCIGPTMFWLYPYKPLLIKTYGIAASVILPVFPFLNYSIIRMFFPIVMFVLVLNTHVCLFLLMLLKVLMLSIEYFVTFGVAIILLPFVVLIIFSL